MAGLDDVTGVTFFPDPDDPSWDYDPSIKKIWGPIKKALLKDPQQQQIRKALQQQQPPSDQDQPATTSYSYPGSLAPY